MVTSITLIGGFAVFDNVFVMTGGGPGTQARCSPRTHQGGFPAKPGRIGSALAILITVLSLVASVVYVRLRERQ